jgi:hypothetical protein
VPAFLAAELGVSANDARRATIAFPHAPSIESTTGASIPGSALYDPAACRERGVPAFTEGSLTRFATPAPPLRVAAHEAAHQLQHAGRTHDAGLGAEGHAHAVAESVCFGVNARPLLGARGRSVAPTLHAYTEIPAATQVVTGQWNIGSNARVADTGLMVTSASITDGHVCYAEPSLIEPANLVLRAKDSGVRLRPGAPGPSGDAPDGSGAKSTVEVIAQVRSATSSGDVWADCGRMSRELQGPAGRDSRSRGFYRDAGGTERQTSSGDPVGIRDEALVSAGLGPDPATAQAAYQAMSSGAREAFDAAHGIGRHAAPSVGQSYMSARDDARTLHGFNFHWGGVVMVSGGDRVTFENFARPGTGYETRNDRWYFDMYGPPSKAGQTWHDRWAEGSGREGVGVGEPGHGSVTIPTRTSADPSAWTAGTPALSTGELITRRAAAAQDGEIMALDAEMRTRWVKASVEVVAEQEGADEVYVRIEHGGRARETGELDMSTGDRNTFWLPLSAIMPVTGTIQVKVYDSDVIRDDLLSIVNLRDVPVSDNRPWDGAEYHTRAEFDR